MGRPISFLLPELEHGDTVRCVESATSLFTKGRLYVINRTEGKKAGVVSNTGYSYYNTLSLFVKEVSEKLKAEDFV